MRFDIKYATIRDKIRHWWYVMWLPRVPCKLCGKMVKDDFLEMMVHITMEHVKYGK